jgi:hypothetical protein
VQSGEREKGKFPSQAMPNSKGQFAVGNLSYSTYRQKQVQSIVTLRSVRHLDNQVDENPAMQQGQESGNKEKGDSEPSKATLVLEGPPRSFVPKVPYPERLQAPKKGGKFEDFVEVFKQIQINISFMDAIQQVPSHAKFLKDLIIINRRMNAPKKAFLTKQVSSFLQCKLPIKYKDPKCLTISCMIGVSRIERAL